MLSPARAAAERLDPLACPPPTALLALSFLLLASTGGKGPWGSGRHLTAFSPNQLTSIPRDPPDLFPHFPPPWHFCGSVQPYPRLLVSLLIRHALPASFVLSPASLVLPPFRRAGSLAREPVKQQSLSGCSSLPGTAGEHGGCPRSRPSQILGQAASQRSRLSPIPQPSSRSCGELGRLPKSRLLLDPADVCLVYSPQELELLQPPIVASLTAKATPCWGPPGMSPLSAWNTFLFLCDLRDVSYHAASAKDIWE